MKKTLIFIGLLIVGLTYIKAQYISSGGGGGGLTQAQVQALIEAAIDTTIGDNSLEAAIDTLIGDNHLAADTATLAGWLRADINDSLGVLLDGATELEDVALMVDDTTLFGVLGSGVGIPGDTLTVNASYSGYGCIHIPEDTAIIRKVIVYIPSGDTLNGSIVYNDTLWATAVCDTIVTIHAIPGKTVVTSFDITNIPEGNEIWWEMDNTVATKIPPKWRAEVIGYRKRD